MILKSKQDSVRKLYSPTATNAKVSRPIRILQTVYKQSRLFVLAKKSAEASDVPFHRKKRLFLCCSTGILFSTF